jgi:serine/threonine-protein kinase
VHAAGLVHRDVKPHNVMREDSGRVVLMDFGAGIELEDLTDGPQRRYVGTPLYMAPELFDRQRPSPQTDLYSLGILLYHLVTGIYPLEGESPTAVHVKHLQGERLRLRDVRPDLPTEFVRIVERAVDPDPAKRYATAGELEADLAQFVVTEDHPGRRVTDGAPHPPPQPRRWRREALAAIAAVVVVAAIGASVLGLRAWRNQSAPPVAPTLRSLVVLPLRNGSGEASQDYFVDGMTELLTADLSGVSALRVIADSAAIRYKGTTKSVHEIANELHVDGIVEGSVVRSGDRVRVTIQVVHAGTNLSVWGSSFEREASDAFRLQAEIATTLVTHLRAALTPDERERLSQTYVAGAEAQDLYLRARAFLRTQSREQLPLARSLLERAVALEPRYALAWTSLSRCYTLLQQIGLMTPADSRRLGVAAATTALRLDGAMFEARGAMGEALFKYDWNWKDADVQYRRALQANPNYSMGRWQYARFLSAAGRVDEAVAQAQLAEQTDPASTDVIRTVATMLFYQRRYAEAAAKASQALAIDGSQASSHTVRGRALAALGQFDGAIGELQEAFRLSDHPGVLAELGRVYALSGNRAAAEEILVRVSQPAAARGDFVAEQDAAYIRLALGRRDEALAGLERAVAQHSERILWLRVDPRVDALRGDPRFERLIRRLGTLS